MSNTSQWIPQDSVVSVVLKNKDCPDYPFLRGTGFFVVFPPYGHVFFITARHCLFGSDNNQLGDLEIPWNGSDNCRETTRFSYCLTATTDTSGEFAEDICVFVVGDMPRERTLHLADRAIKLKHQDDVNSILAHINERRENVRIVGFPSCSKEIDYDDRNHTARARGLYGKIVPNSIKRDGYEVSDLNWKEGELNGFSGSPVLSLHPTSSGGVTPIVVGVVVTGSPKKFSAVNINVATNLIACWIARENNIDIGIRVEVDC